MKRLLKNIFLTLVSLIVFICLAEFSARFAALAYTKSVYAFTYGIDKAVKVNIRNKKISFVDETFKKYSLFYNLLYSIIHREMTQAIKVKPDIEQRWLKAGIADRLIEMGLRNYELNFLEAKKFCDENRIRLVLVRLPALAGAQEDKAQLPVVGIFRERLDRLMLKLSGEHGAGFIDVNRRYKDITGCERFFYDSAHQNRYGNALTAEMIAEGLMVGVYE